MKTHPFVIKLAMVASLFSLRADAYCFLLPHSITYGYNNDGLSAGLAAAMHAEPTVDDLLEHRILLGNIVGITSFDVTLGFANSDAIVVTLKKSQGIGLTADKRGYFTLDILPLDKDQAVNPQSRVRPRKLGLLFSERIGGILRRRYVGASSGATGHHDESTGAYIRLNNIKTFALPNEVTSVAISDIWLFEAQKSYDLASTGRCRRCVLFH